MPVYRTINLPAPLVVQSICSVGLGLYLTAFGHSPFTYGSYSFLVPAAPGPRASESVRLLGIIFTALQSNYLVASYMPLQENQFVVSSVPIRMAVGLLSGLVVAFNRSKMTPAALWEFTALAVAEIASAFWLGRILGRFDGVVDFKRIT